jgi:acyl-CoA dehydrogenase
LRYLVDGLNPERMLAAAGGLGLGRVALRRAVRHGDECVVLGRPIARKQGYTFRWLTRLRSSGIDCGPAKAI